MSRDREPSKKRGGLGAAIWLSIIGIVVSVVVGLYPVVMDPTCRAWRHQLESWTDTTIDQFPSTGVRTAVARVEGDACNLPITTQLTALLTGNLFAGGRDAKPPRGASNVFPKTIPPVIWTAGLNQKITVPEAIKLNRKLETDALILSGLLPDGRVRISAISNYRSGPRPSVLVFLGIKLSHDTALVAPILDLHVQRQAIDGSNTPLVLALRSLAVSSWAQRPLDALIFTDHDGARHKSSALGSLESSITSEIHRISKSNRADESFFVPVLESELLRLRLTQAALQPDVHVPRFLAHLAKGTYPDTSIRVAMRNFGILPSALDRHLLTHPKQHLQLLLHEIRVYEREQLAIATSKGETFDRNRFASTLGNVLTARTVQSRRLADQVKGTPLEQILANIGTAWDDLPTPHPTEVSGTLSRLSSELFRFYFQAAENEKKPLAELALEFAASEVGQSIFTKISGSIQIDFRHLEQQLTIGNSASLADTLRVSNRAVAVGKNAIRHGRTKVARLALRALTRNEQRLLAIGTKTKPPHDVAKGNLQRFLAVNATGEAALYKEAAATFRAVLSSITAVEDSSNWSEAQLGLARSLAGQAEGYRPQLIKQSVDAYTQLLNTWQPSTPLERTRWRSAWGEYCLMAGYGVAALNYDKKWINWANDVCIKGIDLLPNNYSTVLGRAYVAAGIAKHSNRKSDYSQAIVDLRDKADTAVPDELNGGKYQAHILVARLNKAAGEALSDISFFTAGMEHLNTAEKQSEWFGFGLAELLGAHCELAIALNNAEASITTKKNARAICARAFDKYTQVGDSELSQRIARLTKGIK